MTHLTEQPTPREREILALVADDLDGPEIAARLEVSPYTIKSHIQNLRDKSGASSQAGIVAWAFRAGFLS